jgi:tetratricopeptide (TPR) repeat protein
MKKLFFVLAFTAGILPLIYAADPFKDGNKYYLSGQYDSALEQYSNFIKKEPKKFEGYYNAGNALFRQEQYDGALQMYNKALELAPKDEDTKANIEVTQEKLKNQPQKKDNKQQDKKDKKQDQKNGQDSGSKGSKDGKQGNSSQGKQSEGKDGGKQEQGKGEQSASQQGQQGQGQQGGQQQQKSPPNGMSADEVQAIMNQVQNQEKQYRAYFGKQNQQRQNQDQFPNIFNMSPEEIHNFMMRQMMDPNAQQQAPKGNSDEKDW